MILGLGTAYCLSFKLAELFEDFSVVLVFGGIGVSTSESILTAYVGGVYIQEKQVALTNA